MSTSSGYQVKQCSDYGVSGFEVIEKHVEVSGCVREGCDWACTKCLEISWIEGSRGLLVGWRSRNRNQE